MPAIFKLKDHFKENQLYLNRSIAATIVIAIMLIILLSRLFSLQVYHHDTFVTMARNNQVRMVSIPPTRGLIYDRHGVLLAENVPNFSLEITPSRVGNLENLISRLNKIIPISENDIKSFHKQRKYKSRFESIPIKNKLTEEEVARFAIEKYTFPGVEVNANLARYYPFKESFSHVLGYIGPISEKEIEVLDPIKYRGTHMVGKSGIEVSYEDALHGKAGFEQVETDARGRTIRILERIPPVSGNDIYLSIDSQLQQLAYESMGDNQGAVVAIDVKTGGVLALVSKPGYDPNLFIRGIAQDTYDQLQTDRDQPLFNRAIRGQYPPGSTVKPLVALKSLDEQIISTKTQIYDPGFYKLHDEGRLFRDWLPEGHGFIKLENAIAESCTTFFYYLSDKLGIDHMYDIFSSFGLGNVTNIDIRGEASGLAPSAAWKKATKKQSWYNGETLITGIGQGYTLATPIQMASVASTIANRGIRVQPSLIKAFQSPGQPPEQQSIKYQPTVTLKNKQNWEIVIKAMQKTIKSPRGTAHLIYDPNTSYTMAGKTGTAQVFGIKQDEVYDDSKIQENLRDHAWFIAFAPIEEPQISIAVVLEHSKGSHRVAKKIFDAYFRNLKNG